MQPFIMARMENDMKQNLKSLIYIKKYVKPYGTSWLAGQFSNAIGLSFFSVFTAKAVEALINATSSGEKKYFFEGIVQLIIALLMMVLFEVIHKKLFFNAMVRIKASLQNDIFQQIQEESIMYSDNEKPGEKLLRLNQDVELTMDTIGDTFKNFLSAIMMILVSIGAILGKNLTVGLLSAIFVFMLIICNLYYYPKQHEIVEQRLKQKGHLNQTYADSVSGGATIRMVNLRETIQEIWAKQGQDFLRVRKKERILNRRQLLVGKGISMLIIIVPLILCVILYTQNKMLVGTLVFVLQFTLNLSGYGNQLCDEYLRLAKAQAACERIYRLMERPKEKEAYGKETLSPNISTLECRKLHIKVSDKTILRDFDLNLKKGDCAIVTGDSGSGKSTLFSAILQFVSYEGDIVLNGKSIRQYSLDSIRKSIAYVGQEPRLFDCSIRENICLGKMDATEQEWKNAARIANLDQWIETLPERYETVVGEDGSRLSGGERQRIALARAFLKNAPILLLDECTSALDQQNEQKIIEELKRQTADKIILMSAHRKELLSIGNKVIQL